MEVSEPHINPYLFECYFTEFLKFVKKSSGLPFISFAQSYSIYDEGYKYDIWREARAHLAFQHWRKADIGSGKIATAMINAIEIPYNNLVPWDSRYGPENRIHKPLYEKGLAGKVEACLFKLYREQQDEQSFSELIEIFGKQYRLVAYLFFLKDHSRYLPIAPNYFDQAFDLLGAEFKTSKQCSWENYSGYLALIREVKLLLSEKLASEVSLLDAHSFVWILVSQIERKTLLPDVRQYLALESSERDAIVKARIGQGRFRDELVRYWAGCAVTACQEIPLLVASHIKPWSKSTLHERHSLYNGLLLCPNLDKCFDLGYVSFDDTGEIIISNSLSGTNASLLGIQPTMRLKKVETEHKGFLAFHREYVFNDS